MLEKAKAEGTTNGICQIQNWHVLDFKRNDRKTDFS